MVKKTTADAAKEGVSIKQFADEIGVKSDRLLSQLQDAGIKITSIDDLINEDQKQQSGAK